MGETEMMTGSLDLGDECTDSSNYGCSRDSVHGNYLNPITSAKLTTKDSFSFKYGRVEISAKLP
jgi:beta-glucanase (GH16 family)